MYHIWGAFGVQPHQMETFKLSAMETGRAINRSGRSAHLYVDRRAMA